MSLTEIVYSISSDFTSLSGTTIDLRIIERSIKTDIPTTDLSHSTISGNETVKFYFNSALSAGEQTQLDAIVAAYAYVVPPIQSESVVYDAYVSDDIYETADYMSIKDALDDGKKCIFIKAGIYNEVDDLNIPTGCQLIGERAGGVIIDFGGQEFSVKIDPNAGVVASNGVISISDGSKIVTGVGTTFLTNAGGFIKIAEGVYNIASVDSDTQVTLVEDYHGANITGHPYISQNMHENVVFKNLVIRNSASFGIFARGVKNFILESVSIESCLHNILISESFNLSVLRMFSTHSTNSGLKMYQCTDGYFKDSYFSDNSSCGAELTGPSTACISFSSCVFGNNSDMGLKFGYNGCRFMSVKQCKFRNNKNEGIYVLAGDAGAGNESYDNVISECGICYNGGNGVTCESIKTMILDSVITNNGGRGVRLSGAKNSTVSQCLVDTNGSYGVEVVDLSNDCLISGNSALVNAKSGIYINNIHCTNITSNVINHNTENGIEIIGTSSMRFIINGNTAMGNTLSGLYVEDAKALMVTSNLLCSNTRYGIEGIGTLPSYEISLNLFKANTLGTTNSLTTGTGNLIVA